MPNIQNQNQPIALLYNLQFGPRAASIRHYLENAGVKIIDVAANAYEKPIGSLLGFPVFDAYAKADAGASSQKSEAFPEEMIVFHLFGNQRLQDFLDFFKKNDLAPINLKAMVTMHNIFWTSTQLHDEISKEHAMLKR